ncbi:transglutaminase domain-containing protein [Thermococcus alcaliphilus]|uniref:transglutaminase domain-containing protein n=1 Tax=Thermococcus alcaliphilus TaxID=139207 RepID=UPI00209181B8|nr:transglutaminase domain-containing protein [Thermococcus alcaliphilus]MCO6041850.1 transglutaminase domain-containing protein [Thermococcus alcaliphilus]
MFRPIRGGSVPPQWVLYSKLANCGEYAKVFVYLMNKKGIPSRVVATLGGDHAWAEYYVGKHKIIFDPSNPNNPVITDTKSFGRNRNFSYVIAYEIPTSSSAYVFFNSRSWDDVSGEYINRGELVVQVLHKGTPVVNANVEIQSTYLMENFPERYKNPIHVLNKTTTKNGSVLFELGPAKYKIVAEKCFIFLCWKGEAIKNVSSDSRTYVTVELKIDYVRTLFNALLVLFGVAILAKLLHKRYLDKHP